MIIQQDTREQLGKHDHVLKYFKDNGIECYRDMLPVGDYSLYISHRICIDTKQDVLELFMDLTHDHVRFREELIKAQERGIQLVVLVEEKLPKGGLANWKSPVWKFTTSKHKKGEKVTKANPKTMKAAMLTMQKKYGVIFRFCDKSETGKEIVDMLREVQKVEEGSTKS